MYTIEIHDEQLEEIIDCAGRDKVKELHEAITKRFTQVHLNTLVNDNFIRDIDNKLNSIINRVKFKEFYQIVETDTWKRDVKFQKPILQALDRQIEAKCRKELKANWDKLLKEKIQELMVSAEIDKYLNFIIDNKIREVVNNKVDDCVLDVNIGLSMKKEEK